MVRSLVLTCVPLACAAPLLAQEHHPYDDARVPDISGVWKARIGPYDIPYVIHQSGPFFVWRSDLIDEDATGRLLLDGEAYTTLQAEWQGTVAPAGSETATLVRDTGRVVRLEWSHGIVFERSGDAPPPAKPTAAKPAPATLSGDWKAMIGPVEVGYAIREAGPFFIWHSDVLKENGGGRQVLADGDYRSVTAEWVGGIAGAGSGSATLARSGTRVTKMEWESGVVFEPAGAVPPGVPMVEVEKAPAAPVWLPGKTAKPASGPVVKPAGGLGSSGSVKAPPWGSDEARQTTVARGQVLALRNTLYTPTDPSDPPTVPTIARKVADHASLPDGLAAFWSYAEVTDPGIGNRPLRVTFSSNLKDFPRGIVFSIRGELTRPGGFGRRIEVPQPDAFIGGNSMSNWAPWISEAKLPGGRKSSSYTMYASETVGTVKFAGVWRPVMTWFESDRPTTPETAKILAHLPRGTVAGLKHSMFQPDKVLIWNDVVYDPVKLAPVPPGFVRRVGGDAGVRDLPMFGTKGMLPGESHGFFWYEKITEPEG